VSWHLFEPQASLHQQLEQVCASLGSARLNRTAVSDSEGEMQLYSDDEGSGMASLAHRNLSHVGLTMRPLQKVQTITLDSYCEQQNIGTVDFLKLDVEGYELAVLRGATGLLHSRRVAALQFEFGGCNVDTRTFFRDFWELLTSRGYQLHRVTPFGLRRISKYREADEYFLTTNYFARLEQI
jgi:FkbM family methyltransferase